MKLESVLEASHAEPAVISDSESHVPLRIRSENNGGDENAAISKDDKAHLLRGIDDAITSVIEFARKSIADDSHDDRGRTKLQVNDFYDYLSDSDARSEADAKSIGEYPRLCRVNVRQL